MIDILTESEFRQLSLIPREWVDDIAAKYPPEAGQKTWLLQQLELQASEVLAQLDTRYNTSRLASPYPMIIKKWISALVAADLVLLLWFQSNSSDVERYESRAQLARDQIKDAVNSKEGMWQLPLKEGDSTSKAQRSAVRYSSTTSPFLDMRVQRDRGKQEDNSGSPTTGG